LLHLRDLGLLRRRLGARACCNCWVCASYVFSETQADKSSPANGMAAIAAVSFAVTVDLLVAIAVQQSLDAKPILLVS
jgi:hypothetical protein